MNALSLSKKLTTVLFLLSTSFGSSAFAQTKEECAAALSEFREINKYTDDSICKPYVDNAAKYSQCHRAISCFKKENQDATEARSQKRECARAYADYVKDSEEAQSACGSFANPKPEQSDDPLLASVTTTNVIDVKSSCRQKIQSCRDFFSKASSQSGDTSEGAQNMMMIVRTLAMQNMTIEQQQQYSQMMNGTQQQKSNATCIKPFNSKDLKSSRSDFRSRRNELEKEKKKIEDEAMEDKKELTKKNSEIDKKIAELEADLKKFELKTATRLREQQSQNSKTTLEATKKARSINIEITKMNDQMDQIKFNYSNQILSQTTEKINFRCQQQIDKARLCMVNAAKGLPIDKSCPEGMTLNKTKGTVGTQELKTKLEFITKACFENENLTKKNSAFKYQQDLKTLQDRITEAKRSLEDENKQLAQAEADSKSIASESQKEKDTETQSINTQTANLRKELSNFEDDLRQKNATRMQRSNELAKKLEDLDLEERTGAESAISQAETVVNRAVAKIQEVNDVCECDLNPGTNKKICDAITKSESSFDKSNKKIRSKN